MMVIRNKHTNCNRERESISKETKHAEKDEKTEGYKPNKAKLNS